MTFLDDQDIVDESAVDEGDLRVPIAQWQNGDPKLAQLGGVAASGGLLLELDQFVSAPAIPGWTKVDFAFSENTKPVLATGKAAIAVVRTRLQFFQKVNGVTRTFPRSAYQDGMRGHLQALCAIYGFNEPVSITFKGTASQQFERMLAEFQTKVVEPANRLADEIARTDGKKPRRYPRYAFYMKVMPGAIRKAGKGQQTHPVTNPTLELPPEVNPEYLGKVYVGGDKLAELQALYHRAEVWAHAWDKPGMEESDGAAENGND